MTAILTDMVKGGRAVTRVLLLAVCAFGLVLMAKGAVIPVKAGLAQILLERAFDASRVAGRPLRPWPWADTAPVARIGIARLGVERVVLSGGSGQAMAFGPTEMPMAKDSRVTIMAAHRDTHFAFLADAKVGDIVTVEPVKGQTRRYRITGFRVARWDQFAYPRDPARPLLGLVTCYPFDATERGPMRFIAWAEAL
ncbi:MAG TPA: class GN sortase [Sphingobium sp.]|uniref:class GN sortase n=1 Tax=Sphingobium sp. TaxID=1912891 RepID=UPI002ED5050E